jgi:hypothetical protein
MNARHSYIAPDRTLSSATRAHLQQGAELARRLLVLLIGLIQSTCIFQDLLLLLCYLPLAISQVTAHQG